MSEAELTVNQVVNKLRIIALENKKLKILPEPIHDPCADEYTRTFNKGWNACIEQMKKFQK
jgi:hypothetical protein